MALIQLGALIGDIKGRLGGNVFQRSSSGLIMRRQGSTVVKGAPAQDNNRAQVALIQGYWQGLTNFERSGWATYATFRNKATRKSSLAKLNGHALFIQEMTIRLTFQANGGILDPTVLFTPVFTALPPIVLPVSASIVGGALTIETDYSIPDATQFFIWYISAPLLPSQNSKYNKTKFFAFVSDAGTTQSFYSYYQTKYGIIPAEGNYINIEMALYDQVLNSYSPFSFTRLMITP